MDRTVVILIITLAWLHSLNAAFTNLALNKAATQTDTHIGGDASLAVDGSSFQASSYADSGCTRTVSEDASWEVDLGDLYVINQVKIINRLDYVVAPDIDQWVSSIASFSTEYTKEPGWTASEMIGAANVYPNYGDIEGTWAQKDKGIGNEFIEVMFTTKVYVSKVDIYETENSGGVTSIKGRQSGQWIVLWSGAASHIQNVRIFSPPLLTTECFTNHIRIEVDTSISNSWVEIDAVKLHGKENIQVGRLQDVEVYFAREKNAYTLVNYQAGVAGDSVTFTEDMFARWIKVTRRTPFKALSLCEVLVYGFLPDDTATFRRLSSHKPIGTSLKVINSLTSVMKCAAHCDRQMAPRCRSAQYNPSTKTCSLYQWFDNALNTNANSVMLVREYGVRFLT
ncbi:uncharacterized protein LOC127849104 [Dreissena polymorpha]|uniref:uncharacterized protein LOC127848236 n=1 Tax=Dreissena polymorpha TaxID=45954 RepID=UPI002265689B|nr:uncharacterized protein LOC127848236 [Dreissena polymorpha]XP_052237786.1 uncharacterized protein LOC127849104 [Dreissena polymorpha]